MAQLSAPRDLIKKDKNMHSQKHFHMNVDSSFIHMS
jgi:hypothetical protein